MKEVTLARHHGYMEVDIRLHQGNNGCYISKCIKHNCHQWVRRITLREHSGNRQMVAARHLEVQGGNTVHPLHYRGTGKNTKANASGDPRAYDMLFICHRNSTRGIFDRR